MLKNKHIFVMSGGWYIYNGPAGMPAEATVGNYNFTIADPETICPGGEHVCAVYALYGGRHPEDISEKLKEYIASAKISQSSAPTGFGAQRYVFTRP